MPDQTRKAMTALNTSQYSCRMTRTELDPSDDTPATAAAAGTGWQASLRLGFCDDGGTTRLVERWHSGPLRVQKPLYPEGKRPCHAAIIHPPGGVVGGDRLDIRVGLAERSQALITTPGAAKWYRSNGRRSQQQVRLELGPGSSLEWLPQESILFDDAQVRLSQHIELAADACYIGADILCFGRTAAGERFGSGEIRQHTEIRRAGKLIWWEQGAIGGGTSAMQSPLVLQGKTVCASVLACGPALTAGAMAALREQTTALVQQREPGAACGASQMKAVLVARYLGNSSETARLWTMLVWQHLRPAMLGRAAQTPRLWNT